MERTFKHTIENSVQCFHNNTGYCKFGDKCRFQHYYELCTKQICRDSQCKFRHPKSCKFGGKCKFFQRKICFYKHIEKSNDEVDTSNGLMKDLVTEIDKLKAEIRDLQSCILSKEKEIDKITTEKEKSKASVTAKITNMQKEIEKFKLLNDDLEQKINTKESKIQNQSKEIENLKVLVKTQNLDNRVTKQNLQVPSNMNGDIETINSTHSNKCQYCGKLFDNKSILKEHIINHSGPNILQFKSLDSEESDWETDDE